MFEKIILCANPKQATVGLWRMGKLVSCSEFADDEAGHDGFRQWLQPHRRIPIRIIADTAEEDFRLETIPHVMGRARKELLDRKLNQHYRNIDFRAAQFVDREMTGRRDDRFLLMALIKADAVSPWLGITEELQTPLAGIYLLPAVSRQLIKILHIEHANLLLTTRQSISLRQSHVTGPALRLSRLISVPDNSNSHGLYIGETEKALLYLLNAQAFASPTPLHLVFAGLEEAGAALAQHMELHPEASCTVISTSDVAHRLGIEAELLRRYPDLMHMHVLARCDSSGNLAPARLMGPLRLRQFGMGLNLASTACVAGAAIFAAINTLDSMQLERQTRQLATQVRHQENLYAEVVRNFPKTPLPGNELKAAVELANRIDSLNRTPLRMMQVVSHALDRQQEIRLNRLRWQLADSLDSRDEENQGTAPPFSSLAVHELGFIEGGIASFTGDYRTALDSLNRLVVQLKSHKQVERVVILQQPLNTSPLASLQGSTLDQHAPAARFKLKIVLKELPS